MLNEKKVKYMTKAATFETGEKRKDLKISGYFRNDYIGLGLLRSLAAYTMAFVMIVGIWFVSDLEKMLNRIVDSQNMVQYGVIFGILYGAGLFLYEVIAYWYYSKQYQSARSNTAEYTELLKKIEKIYEDPMDTVPVSEEEIQEGDEHYDDFRI